MIDGTGEKVNLQHLPLESIKIFKNKGGSIPAMLNQALKECTGTYVHLLFPGEYYVWDNALKFMQKMIQGYRFPDLIYTPRRNRHHFGQPTLDLFPLTIKILKQGSVPWTVQWFFLRREALVMLGGFSEKYKIRWGYELLCRFFQAPTLTKAFVKRLLTDYEYRRPPSDWVWRQSKETARVSFKYFGLSYEIISWMMRNCLRLFRFSWKIIRASFWKKHVATAS